jgi:hypothetical protein
MQRNLVEGDEIKTAAGTGKIRRIGPIQRSDSSKYAWAMLTLDLAGQTAYCVAREDELLRSD